MFYPQLDKGIPDRPDTAGFGLGSKSDSNQVISGLPQGTVLGPLLFLLFTNDPSDGVQSCTRLFADDCILYKKIKNQEDCTILQEDINRLAEREKKMGMEFHPRDM